VFLVHTGQISYLCTRKGAEAAKIASGFTAWTISRLNDEIGGKGQSFAVSYPCESENRAGSAANASERGM